MPQGDANALRCCLALSQKIRGIMAAFPKDTPVISSHPIVGNMAVACGFKTVINLIFDNYPQQPASKVDGRQGARLGLNLWVGTWDARFPRCTGILVSWWLSWLLQCGPGNDTSNHRCRWCCAVPSRQPNTQSCIGSPKMSKGYKVSMQIYATAPGNATVLILPPRRRIPQGTKYCMCPSGSPSASQCRRETPQFFQTLWGTLSWYRARSIWYSHLHTLTNSWIWDVLHTAFSWRGIGYLATCASTQSQTARTGTASDPRSMLLFCHFFY